MAKTITITFNQDGSLVQNLSSAAGIRQGDGAGEVTFKAVFQNQRNDLYVAKLHYKRPDEKTARNLIMTPAEDDPHAFVMQANTSWFFAVPGTARATVTITSESGIAAEGSYSFEIEETEVDVSNSTITYDEAAAIEALIAGLSADSLKRATTITPEASASSIDDFISACYAYTSPIKDGDRYVMASSVEGGASSEYFGEFMSTDTLFVLHLSIENGAESRVAYLASKSGNDITKKRIAMNDDIESLISTYFVGDAAKKAVADKDGNQIDTTYAKKSASNTFTQPNTFAEPITSDKGVILGSNAKVRVASKSSFAKVATDEGENFTKYDLPYDHTDSAGSGENAQSMKGATLIIATSIDVDRAKAEAILAATGASAITLEQFISNLLGGDVRIGGSLTLGGDLVIEGKVVSVDSETISTESRFIQLMKGNTVALSGWRGHTTPTGPITVSNGVRKGPAFFYGMKGDTMVLGNVTATYNDDGDVIDVTDLPTPETIALACRADSSLLGNNHILIWDSTNLKIVDSGYTIGDFVAAENVRVSNENARIAAESARVTAEEGRVSAEASRVTAEQGRASAEADRQYYYGAAPIPLRFCTQAEYDFIHGGGYINWATRAQSETPLPGYEGYLNNAKYEITNDFTLQNIEARIQLLQDAIAVQGKHSLGNFDSRDQFLTACKNYWEGGGECLVCYGSYNTNHLYAIRRNKGDTITTIMLFGDTNGKATVSGLSWTVNEFAMQTDVDSLFTNKEDKPYDLVVSNGQCAVGRKGVYVVDLVSSNPSYIGQPFGSVANGQTVVHWTSLLIVEDLEEPAAGSCAVVPDNTPGNSFGFVMVGAYYDQTAGAIKSLLSGYSINTVHLLHNFGA